MEIVILPHARESMQERGVIESEVIQAVMQGEMVPAKGVRIRFMKNFIFDDMWRGNYYKIKQVHAIVAVHGAERRVVTVIAKYFGKD